MKQEKLFPNFALIISIYLLSLVGYPCLATEETIIPSPQELTETAQSMQVPAETPPSTSTTLNIQNANSTQSSALERLSPDQASQNSSEIRTQQSKQKTLSHKPDIVIDGDDADLSKVWTTHLNLSAYVETDTYDKGGASWSGSSYLSVNYKIDGDQRLSMRPVFYFNTAGFNKYGDSLSTETSLGDFYFVYSHYDLFETKTDSYSLSFTQRLYLPTSDYSKATKMITRSGTSLLHKFQVARYSYFTISQGFDYYFQSQKASLDPKIQTYPDGVTKWDPRKGNQQMALSHNIEFVHSFSRHWEASARIGLYDSWFYGSDAVAAATGVSLDSKHSTELSGSLGGKYKMRHDTDLRASFTNSAYLGTGYSFGRPNDNEVSVGANIRF